MSLVETKETQQWVLATKSALMPKVPAQRLSPMMAESPIVSLCGNKFDTGQLKSLDQEGGRYERKEIDADIIHEPNFRRREAATRGHARYQQQREQRNCGCT
jgi:hypothetical protein